MTLVVIFTSGISAAIGCESSTGYTGARVARGVGGGSRHVHARTRLTVRTFTRIRNRFTLVYVETFQSSLKYDCYYLVTFLFIISSYYFMTIQKRNHFQSLIKHKNFEELADKLD